MFNSVSEALIHVKFMIKLQMEGTTTDIPYWRDYQVSEKESYKHFLLNYWLKCIVKVNKGLTGWGIKIIV